MKSVHYYPSYMRTLIFFLAIVTATHFGGSCKKSVPTEPPRPDTLRADPAVLAYISFPENSYRIYRDSASGALDSILIADNKFTFDYLCCHQYLNINYPPYYAERIHIRWEKRN